MKTTTIHDYVDQLCEQFPQVPKSDIYKILNYGWKQIYLCNSYGGDVEIGRGTNFYVYIGKAFLNPLKQFFYYTKKMIIKTIVVYKRRRIKWDGYYYFALTKRQKEHLDKQYNPNKKIFNYGNQVLFKNYDECRVRQWDRHYIYRVKSRVDFGRSLYKPDFTTDKAEFYEYRPSIKFDGLLVSNKGNYKYV